MSLLTAGYMPTSYVPESYFNDDYFPDYGSVTSSSWRELLAFDSAVTQSLFFTGVITKTISFDSALED